MDEQKKRKRKNPVPKRRKRPVKKPKDLYEEETEEAPARLSEEDLKFLL